MKPSFILLLIFLAAANTVQSEECRVKTSDFTVVGSVAHLARYDTSYEKYICIRYAEPPEGQIRFGPPVGVDLKGTIYANGETCPICPQQPTKLAPPGQIANEDCLFLNVFVPRNCGKRPLKVVVYIHGGSFISGNGPLLPSFLLGECVIVVTFNYRLGALGFLSLQTQLCPGNAGLKDQQLALFWVKKYIKHFGGDPHNVVLYGLSAGGGSVTYHLLNSKSCELFIRGIIESGVFLNGWAFEKPEVALEKGRALAGNVGCTGTDEELCECLRNIPSEVIVAKANSVLGLSDVVAFRVIPFGPTIEAKSSRQPFLTDNPFTLLINGLYCKRDLIIGVTKDEGCIFNSTVQQFKFALPFLSTLIKNTAPSCIADNPDPTCDDIVTTEMLNHYTEYGQVDDQNIFTLITDVQFKLGTLQMIEIMAKQGVTIYLYELTFCGECGPSNLLNPGTTLVCHGENFVYVFVTPYTSACLDQKESKFSVTSKRVVTLYANFAKFGTPTFFIHSSGQYINVYWLPWNRFLQFYLEIGESLKLKTCLEKETMGFWNRLSRECCEGSKGKNPYPSCSLSEIFT